MVDNVASSGERQLVQTAYKFNKEVEDQQALTELLERQRQTIRQLRRYEKTVLNQNRKYAYVVSLAELAASGNSAAIACILPCAKMARQVTASIKDLKRAARKNSGGLFGIKTDPYADAAIKAMQGEGE